MEEENNNKYLSLKENFPPLFNFLQWCLPREKLEEWIGDVDENINEKAKEKKYSTGKIKWMYILESMSILHSARKMGYLRWDKLIPELFKNGVKIPGSAARRIAKEETEAKRRKTEKTEQDHPEEIKQKKNRKQMTEEQNRRATIFFWEEFFWGGEGEGERRVGVGRGLGVGVVIV